MMRVDRQLTGRGGMPYKIIEPYDWESTNGRESFRLLCGVIDKALPFEHRSGLYNAALAERLYFVTQGSIGRLKDLPCSAPERWLSTTMPQRSNCITWRKHTMK